MAASSKARTSVALKPPSAFALVQAFSSIRWLTLDSLEIRRTRVNSSRPLSGFAERSPENAPAPPPAPLQSIVVPSGTRITIRTIDGVDSDKNHPGDKFLASLEQPLIVNDVTLAPKGASVYGRLQQVQAAGQLTGKSRRLRVWL